MTIFFVDPNGKEKSVVLGSSSTRHHNLTLEKSNLKQGYYCSLFRVFDDGRTNNSREPSTDAIKPLKLTASDSSVMNKNALVDSAQTKGDISHNRCAWEHCPIHNDERLGHEPLNDEGKKLNTFIVIDLNNNGVETTGFSNAHFDHDGNEMRELTGWVTKTEGLLARDLNNDGKINNGAELFGSNTLLKNGKKAQNGFEVLAEYDHNGDGVIDKNDSIFDSLIIWQDLNSNGSTEYNELKPLAELGIVSITTEYQNFRHKDPYGNEHRQQGHVTFEDGSMVGGAVDVWFNTNPIQRIDAQILIDSSVAQLPDAKGFGIVHNLRKAMVLDPELRKRVAAFISKKDTRIKDILLDGLIYHWTGADKVDPLSRGRYMDARQVVALEHLLDKKLPYYTTASHQNQSSGERYIQEYRKFKYFTEATIRAYSDSSFVIGVINTNTHYVRWSQLASELIDLVNNGDRLKALRLIAILDNLHIYSKGYDLERQAFLNKHADLAFLLGHTISSINLFTVNSKDWSSLALDLSNHQTPLGRIDTIQFEGDMSIKDIDLLLYNNDISLKLIEKKSNRFIDIENASSLKEIRFNDGRITFFSCDKTLFFGQGITTVMIQESNRIGDGLLLEMNTYGMIEKVLIKNFFDNQCKVIGGNFKFINGAVITYQDVPTLINLMFWKNQLKRLFYKSEQLLCGNQN